MAHACGPQCHSVQMEYGRCDRVKFFSEKILEYQVNMNANALRLLATVMLTTSAMASRIHFKTNDPDGRMAMASHPPSASAAENESADDFVGVDARYANLARLTTCG